MNLLKIALLVLAGLTLFLFTLNTLSEGLKALTGERLKSWLARFTRTIGTDILTGLVVTTVSSQLIALDIGQWAGLPMAVGFGLMVTTRREYAAQPGRVLLTPLATPLFERWGQRRSAHS